MKVKKNTKKKEEKQVKEVKNEKVEKPVEKKEVKAAKEKKIQIKQRTFDVEKKMQFSNWVVEKQFVVLEETDDTYTFGNDAKIKLGVVRKSDCVEV